MGRLITGGYLEPLEKGALCLHTRMYTHTHTQSLLTPNFALSPNFREGAEVNTSTIKAFFEQNRSIILWVSRVQILISLLNSASSPLRRERNGEKLQEPVFRNRTFYLFEDWCTGQPPHTTERRFLRARGSVRLSWWSAPRWRRAEGHSARFWRSAGAWGRLWSCS